MQCENFMYVIDVTKDWFLHLRFNHNCKSITNAKSPPAEGVFLNVYFKKVEDLLLHSLALAFWTCWPTSNTLDKNTEMSSTFRTLKFVENGQQTAGLLLATLSERLINLFLDTKESVCTTCEEKQIWLVSLTELSFEVNFPDIEDLQLRMLKRKWCSQEDLWKEAEGSVAGIKIQKLLKMRKKMVGVESEKKKKHSQVLKDWSLRILNTVL